MAEIPVQRKTNLTWLWILLAILVIIALIWWAAAEDDEELITEPADIEAVEPLPDTEPAATIAAILANPDAYVGMDNFTAEASVPEVPTDRGFWVESDGQRLFAIIIDQPAEEPKDINPGQRLRITEGMIRDSSYLPNLSGDPLDADTQRTVEQQDVFLVVDEDNIEILEAGTPQAGTG